MPVLRPHRFLIVSSLLLGLVGSVAVMTTPIYLKRALDEGIVERTTPLSELVVALVAISVFAGICQVANRRRMQRMAATIDADLRGIVQRHLGRQSFAFHDAHESGQLISRANSDLQVIQMFLSWAPNVSMHYLGFLWALALMLRTHVGLTLVTLSVMPAVAIIGIRMRQLTYPLSHLVQTRTASVTSIVAENLTGAHVVRAMSAEVDQIRRLDVAAERLRWAAEQEVTTRARYQPLMSTVPQISTAAFLLVAGWLAVSKSVTVGEILLFTSYIGLLQFPFRVAGFFVVMAQRARAASGRVFEILDGAPLIKDSPDALELVDLTGSVVFEKVHFGYDGGPEVLHGIDLEVVAGEKVALVGRTASGKSTMLWLLARFYDTTAGTIRIDGYDVRGVTQTSLRRNVGIVQDDAFLFTATVRDNIAYARPDATFEDITAAAEAAGARSFIEELPSGWDTVVGERGYTLSGGQRQRVAIARALVQNPAVLLLDDATSAIDVEVEQRIHRALEMSLEDRTTVMVAHRPATIALADRVVLMDEGHIVATGTHEWLLTNEERYREVLAQQTGTSHKPTSAPSEQPRQTTDAPGTRTGMAATATATSA